MKRRFATVGLILAGTALAAGPGYKVASKIKIGGTNGWDYVYVDSGAQRLYVSHTTQVEVIDLSKMEVVGKIPDTNGVHGIAIASDLGRGFTSNGRDNSVTIFDTKTLSFISKTSVGMNPDAILYEPSTHRVFTFNGNSKDATVVDAKTGGVLSTIPLGGKPEFSQTNGKGTVWVNIENTAEVVEIDAAKASATKRYSLAPCEEPTGLAFDSSKDRLFSACSNNMAAVSDPKAGKLLATVPIGAGADGIAFDNGMAFTSNGGDGTVTVIGEQGGKWGVLETVPTQRTARTIGADSKTHRLFLPAAESGAPAVTKDGKQGRPTLLPDSFSVVVLAR
jgi:DNA-binding beta-propeller fold protein YncE